MLSARRRVSKMSEFTVALAAEADTVRLGAAVAAQVKRGDVIALHGPLGAGKTTLARGLVHSLTDTDEEIVSPTFTLAQMYETPRGVVWHFDLYRLKSADEALEIGIEEAFTDGISLIEWPERLGTLLPKKRLDIYLSHDGSGRKALLSGASWDDRLPEVVKHVG